MPTIKTRTAARKPGKPAPVTASALGSARMNLITCPTCGKRFSKAAAACPACGQPNMDVRARAIATNDRRSRGVYICLALFLGYFGIHNFYAGRICRALLELFGFPALGLACGFGGKLAGHGGGAMAFAFIWLLVPIIVIIMEMILTTTDGRDVPFS